jgi:hypothetical protein
LPGDETVPNQTGSGLIKGGLIHTQLCHEGRISVKTQPLVIGYTYQEQIQGSLAMAAVFDMSVSYQPVIDPAEAFWNLADTMF